jgi:hypothetical protein
MGVAVVRLSIVIPFLGNLKRLEDTLVSVLENRPADSEIVVVLREPYNDPYDLAGEVRFVEAPVRAGRGDCIDLAMAASSAPILHVMGCGIEATPGWTDRAMAHFSDPQVAAVTPLVLDRFDSGRILSAGLDFTPGGAIRRLGVGKLLERFVCEPGGLGAAELLVAFYRRSALEAVGPLGDLRSDRPAGVDLALMLQYAGYLCLVEPECLTLANRETMAVESAWQEGMEAEALFWRWARASGWRRALLGHAGLLATECLRCPVQPATVCRLAGRFWSGLGLGPRRRPLKAVELSGAVAGHTIRPPHFATSEARSNPVRTRAAG